MPLSVNHNGAGVSILDLEEVPNQRVGCHGADKVSSGRTEPLSRVVTVLTHEIVVEAYICLPAKLVSGFSIRNALNNSASRRCGYHSVRK